MLFGFLLYLQWDAMLITYLSTRAMVLPFDNLISILEKSSHQIAVLPGTAFEDTFKASNDPLYQKAWNERILPNMDLYRSYDVGGTYVGLRQEAKSQKNYPFFYRQETGSPFV